MILVDTSVWIDHLRRPIQELSQHLRGRRIVCHEMVIGELACGNLRNRKGALHDLGELPVLDTLPAREIIDLIETRLWMGRGIGFVDANLLGSVIAHEKATLWTRDRRLHRLAGEVGRVHVP
ncbi:MAG: type II toxin-antitoxin system VapC family toxin [Gammaproteobacteria bacterium]|nr:type II toxin-antitoxin system VapC family toxin [Gammaproteobacteria bacterium]MDE0270963.1 type II toxin-antitoxin system VapC family toxin [Gammaproteobacteria bacterium]